MIKHNYLDHLRDSIREKNNNIAFKRKKWVQTNSYYYKQVLNTLNFIVEPNTSVLHLRCSTGDILNGLQCSEKVGIDDSENLIYEAKKEYSDIEFIHSSVEKFSLDRTFDYILVTSVEDVVDIKAVLDCIYLHSTEQTRVIILNYNYLWNPLVKLAEKTGMKIPQNLHNWISEKDVNSFLELSQFEKIINYRSILFPFNIPVLSWFLNKYLARLPILRRLTMLNFTIARKEAFEPKEHSVSIVIPCRNEAGNIEDAVTRIPKFGSHIEILFGDDKSTDGTADKVREMIAKYPDKDIKLYNGPGISKSENVWAGFDLAACDIVLILDADLTVIPEELPYFYEAITKRNGEFINGSRLVYPMHNNAMKLFNIIGNKFFSIAFSYILDRPIKDTLCGTKVMWRRDYQRIKKLRGTWGLTDRWGDYELIFSAAKLNLKIIDLPVHYYERVYGETKMTGRIQNGIIMLKMCWAALNKIKFH
jgi:hypothetical protein